MAFKQHGSLNAQGAPTLQKLILVNSITSVLMDAVQGASGFMTNASMPGDLLTGHVVAHVTNSGMGLLVTGAAGASIGSYAGSFATASDNQTVAKVSVLVDISKLTQYSGSTDVAIGTTSGSNLFGFHTDLADAANIDEDNGGTVTVATAQYLIWGIDPNTSSRGIYSIYESAIFGV